MAKMTKAEWQAQLDECGGDLSQDDLINLIYKEGPNALWTETIQEMHLAQPMSGLYNYLNSLLPRRVWKDWSGITELGKVYHPAYIPFDLSVFQRTMEICDPTNLNECHTDYCEIPQGGVSNIPELEMYKAGFKTRRMCIANIRTSSQAKQIAELIVKERFGVDDQLMNMFYTMAVIRMLGHKWILEYETTDGYQVPVANNNPYNILQGFRYNYMEPLFPQVGNLQNIMPLDMPVLDMLGRGLVDSRNPNYQSTGPRGEPIFELWHGSDWWKQEMLDNREYIDRMKYTMPTAMLPGYTLGNGPAEKEIVGNFSMRQMPMLPRFAESTAGGITLVQPMVNTPVEQGNRATFNYREYQNAPFILTLVIGKNIGEMLTRPAINVGIEGKPIYPITGDADWRYRNDYDKECNPDLNMPYFDKRFEMGFRMKNPDAGWGLISRAKRFRLKALNTCDLLPVFAVTPGGDGLGDCDFLTIGCHGVGKTASNSITEQTNVRHVICDSQVCGDPTIYRLTIRGKAIDKITPGQNPFGECACGDDLMLLVGDADGDTTKEKTGTIVDVMRPNIVTPYYTVLVKLSAALLSGECIQGVACPDATTGYALVVACQDDTDDDGIPNNNVDFLLDGPLACDVGEAVSIKYYDEDGVQIGATITGAIVSINPETLKYRISSAVSGGFQCAMRDGQVQVRISCD